MKHRKNTLSIILVIVFAVFAIISLISHSALTKDYKTVYLPIPVGIDLERSVESSMVIKVDTKSYDNIGFKEFTSKYKKPEETRFKDLILALRDKDYTKVTAMTNNGSDRTEENMKALINHFSNSFSIENLGKDFEGLKIIKCVKFGNQILFIWTSESLSDSDNVPYFSYLRFQKDNSGSILWNTDYTINPLCNILRDIIWKQVETPGTYLPRESATLKYKVPLIEDGHKKQAYLCFDGMVCDVNTYSDSISSNEIISFYQEAYHTLRNQGIGEFSKYYTESSGKKIFDWYSKTEDYNKYALGELIKNERKIVFVLNGDPVFLVFYYNPKYKITNDVMNHIKYEYIIRENGTLKFTNYAYGDAFDQLLGNGEQLQNPFLKSFIKEIIEKEK